MNHYLSVVLACLSTISCMTKPNPKNSKIEMPRVQESNLLAINEPSEDWRWPNPKHISVCWEKLAYPIPENHEPIPGLNLSSYKKEVRKVVTREYSRAGIYFEGWGECDKKHSDIKIYMNFEHNLSPIGYNKNRKTNTILLDVFADFYSMKSRRFRRFALHEFGHTLGLLHEDDRRDASENCIKFDTKADLFYENIHVGDYNPHSIMSYCSDKTHPFLIQHPIKTFEDGQAFDLAGSVLSEEDVKKFHAIYFETTAFINEKVSKFVDSNLTLHVGGLDIESYKYVIGKYESLNCKDPYQYSSETLISKSLLVDVNPFMGSRIKICILGKNKSGHWQSTEHYTSLSTTVSISPVTEITDTSYLIKGKKHFHIVPKVNLKGILLKWGRLYKTDCKSDTEYEVIDDVKNGFDIEPSAHGLSSTHIRLCLRSKMEDNSIQISEEANSYLFSFSDSFKIEELIGYVDENGNKPTSITKDEFKRLSLIPEPEPILYKSTIFYKFKFVKSKSECFLNTNYSTPQHVGTSFSHPDIEVSHTDTVFLCLLKGIDTTWQPTEQATVHQIDIRPNLKQEL